MQEMGTAAKGVCAHNAAVATVVDVSVDVGLAAGGGRCQRAVLRPAGLEAVRAEARVVCLARALQVARLCAHTTQMSQQ